MRLTTVSACVLAACFWAAPFLAAPAAAQTRLAVNCPNGPPCMLEVSGHVDAVGSARLPWITSVVAPAGLCLSARIGDSKRDGPIEISIVGPDGKVYRRRYLQGFVFAQVDSTTNGWYTIEVDSQLPGAEQIFTLNILLDRTVACP